MAILTGKLFPNSEGENAAAWQGLLGPDRIFSAQAGTPDPIVKGDLLTNNQPTSPYSKGIDGKAFQSFSFDWYNRIHILPSNQLNVGNVSDGQQELFSVWNAYFVPQTLDSLTQSNNTGIILSTAKIGSVWQPLENVFYTLTFSLAGPSAVNANYDYDFLLGLPSVLNVIGFRTVLFLLAPDWSKGYKETITFPTDIIASHNDKEQRMGLKKYPRMTIEFSVVDHDLAVAQISNIFNFWHGLPFDVPLWSDAAKLVNSPAIGTNSFSFDDLSNRRFEVGNSLLIYRRDGTSETFKIDTIVSNVITTTFNSSIAWTPSQTYGFPMLSTRPSKVTLADYSVENVMTSRVSFEVDQIPPYTSTETTLYRNIGIIEDTHNWIRLPKHSYSRKAFTFDPKTSINKFVIMEGDIPYRIQSYNAFLRSKASIKAFYDMIYFRRGRLRPIWLPTWTDDLTLVLPFSSADTEIHVQNIGMATYSGGINRRDIMILLNDGTQFFRRISSIIDNLDGTEKFSIDTSVGQDVALADIRIMCFVSLMRLDRDRVSITWKNLEIAESDITFRSINHDV